MNHEITHKSRGVEICKSVACNLTLEHMVQLHGVKKAVIGTLQMLCATWALHSNFIKLLYAEVTCMLGICLFLDA